MQPVHFLLQLIAPALERREPFAGLCYLLEQRVSTLLSSVNGIAQIAPFDVAAKQALLEAPDLQTRADLIIQLMQFFGRHGGEDRVTLQ